MGIWNCLVGDTEAIIIDFEDSTTRTKIENAWEVFAKCPFTKYRVLFETGAIEQAQRIKEVIDRLEKRQAELTAVGAWSQRAL